MSFAWNTLPFAPAVTAERFDPQTSQWTRLLARLAGRLWRGLPSHHDELASLSKAMLADIGLQPDVHYRARSITPSAIRDGIIMRF